MRRRERWLRRHPLCLVCQAQGLVTLATEIDHVIPLHKGGEDAERNFQSLCATCHQDKTAYDRGWKVRQTTGLDGWPVAPAKS